VFLLGFWRKRCDFCGSLLVSSWWLVWWTWLVRTMFSDGGEYDRFFEFIFRGYVLPAGPAARGRGHFVTCIRLRVGLPLVGTEMIPTMGRTYTFCAGLAGMRVTK
jgi:hypothetical protein